MRTGVNWVKPWLRQVHDHHNIACAQLMNAMIVAHKQTH